MWKLEYEKKKILKTTNDICLNESINLSQFLNMSEKGDDSSPFSKPMEVR